MRPQERKRSSRSQNVTLKRGQNTKYLPSAFTEYCALMHPLRVVRVFAKMRETLRAAPNLARKLAVLEKKLTGRLDVHEAAIVGVLQELMTILNPPPGPPSPPKPKIGFVP